jgi:hypothetical protein
MTAAARIALSSDGQVGEPNCPDQAADGQQKAGRVGQKKGQGAATAPSDIGEHEEQRPYGPVLIVRQPEVVPPFARAPVLIVTPDPLQQIEVGRTVMTVAPT